MEDYRDAIRARRIPVYRGYRMTDDDRIRWAVISRFLAYMSVDFHDIDEQFGIESRSYFAEELAALGPFIEDGLVERTPDSFRATDTGRFFARHVCTLFDRYASAKDRETKSKFTPAIQRSQSQ
jgi:oxygen-independent coproporphyrinogen-3 oxidase